MANPVQPIETRAAGAEARLARMQSQLDALQRLVGGLLSAGAGFSRVTLTAAQTEVWLGLPVELVANVQDLLSGAPRLGVPVTFVTSWGGLRTVGARGVETGSSLTVRSDLAGQIRLIWLPPAGQEMWDAERAALRSALQALDLAAPTPAALREPFNRLAHQYGQEANLLLRRAVDIFFDDFRTRLADPVNITDFMAAWADLHTSVVAYVGEEDQAAVVGGVGCLGLRLKDWVGPLFQAYLGLPEHHQAFQSAFQAALENRQGTDDLIDDLYRGTQTLIEEHPGVMGQSAARRIADASLQAFGDTLGDLPLDVRLAVFPALQLASRQVSTGGAGALEMVAQNRLSAGRQLGTPDISGLTARLDLLNEVLGQKAGAAALDALREELAAQIGQKADAGRLDTLVDVTRLDSFGRELNALVDIRLGQQETRLKTATEDFSTRIGQQETQLKAATDQVSALKTAADQLSTRMGQQETQLKTSTDQLSTRMGQQETQLKAATDQVSALRTAADQLSTRIGQQETQLKIATDQLSARMGQQETQFKAATEQVSALKTAADQLSTRMGQQDTQLKAATEQVSALKTAADQLSTRMGQQETQLKAATEQVSALKTAADQLSTRMGQQDTQLKAATEQVSALKTAADQLSTRMGQQDTQLKAATEQVSALKTAADQLSTRMGQQETQLKAATDQVSALKTVTDQISTRMGQQETQLKAATDQLSTRMGQQETQLKAATEQVSALRTAADQLSTRLGQQETQLKAATDQVAALKTAADQLFIRMRQQEIQLRTTTEQLNAGLAARLPISQFETFSQSIDMQLRAKFSAEDFNAFVSKNIDPMTETVRRLRVDVDKLLR